MVLSFTCDRFAMWLLVQPLGDSSPLPGVESMVATNTRRKRASFVKRVERWDANLVALTLLMGSLIGLLRRAAQVVLIVVAVVGVFCPGLLPLVAAGAALLLQVRRS
jgi:hypothetical protein